MCVCVCVCVCRACVHVYMSVNMHLQNVHSSYKDLFEMCTFLPVVLSSDLVHVAPLPLLLLGDLQPSSSTFAELLRLLPNNDYCLSERNVIMLVCK